MKLRISSSVTASEYPGYRQQAHKMKEICESFAKRHYGGGVVGNITFREMCKFPTIYVDLEIDGHLCYAIFNMFSADSVEVEAGPPRVVSVKGVDEAMQLSTLYTKFASVIQALWSALDAAAKAGEFKEVY